MTAIADHAPVTYRIWRRRGINPADVRRGYVREGDDRHAADAVRWWYIAEIAGLPFARGGRVAKARQARRALEAAHEEAMREAARVVVLRTSMFDLLEDGSLRPIPRKDDGE